jgi:oligoribonuclease
MEIGLHATNRALGTLGTWSSILNYPRSELQHMSDWSLEQHGKSGLLKASLISGLSARRAEEEALTWVMSYQVSGVFIKPGTMPMYGASVHFDREWLRSHMPDLHKWFHYGNVDVSSFKRLFKLWWPSLEPPKAREEHRVGPDNEDSIALLHWYADTGLLLRPGGAAWDENSTWVNSLNSLR